MPTFILPNAIDANGDPVNGALAKVYLADGTTPATTYSDEAMSAANAWPIVYSAAGTPGACYVAEGEYKLDLQTSAGVSLDGYPKDDIAVFAFPIGLATGGTGTTTGPTLPIRTELTSGTAATYTTPAGCRKLFVECIGAGGGGGNADGQGSGYAGLGGSGGAGGYCAREITSPGASYTYTVGAGGAGGAASAGANNGSDGTATTFSDGGSVNMSAGYGAGGTGHVGINTSNVVAGGAGGTSTGGDVNVTGEHGGYQRIITGVPASTHGGGNTILGAGGVTTAGTGIDASGYGSGGGGAVAWGVTTDFAGGDGANGIIVVWEVF